MAKAAAQNEQPEHIVRGMAAATGAMLMFTIMNVFAKYLSTNHSVIEIAFYRNLVACIPFLALTFVFGRREILVIHSQPRLIAVRAVLGTCTLLTTFAAFSLMPMAETVVLLFTASLFIPILGVLFLKESVGPYRWSAVFIGFAGVAIMSNPSGTMNVLGVTVALTAALMQAVMSILLRHLGGHERPETISLYFFIIGTFITGLALPFVATGPTLAEVPLFFGIGLSGAAAQWLYSVALKYSPATVVGIFSYSSIIWATLCGWMIWNEWPMPIVFAGSAVVIASNLLIAWRESRVYRSGAQRLGHVD